HLVPVKNTRVTFQLDRRSGYSPRSGLPVRPYGRPSALLTGRPFSFPCVASKGALRFHLIAVLISSPWSAPPREATTPRPHPCADGAVLLAVGQDRAYPLTLWVSQWRGSILSSAKPAKPWLMNCLPTF